MTRGVLASVAATASGDRASADTLERSRISRMRMAAGLCAMVVGQLLAALLQDVAASTAAPAPSLSMSSTMRSTQARASRCASGSDGGSDESVQQLVFEWLLRAGAAPHAPVVGDDVADHAARPRGIALRIVRTFRGKHAYAHLLKHLAGLIAVAGEPAHVCLQHG